MTNASSAHATGTWRKALELDELWEGDMTGVEVAGTKVLLVNMDGEVRAYEPVPAPGIGARRRRLRRREDHLRAPPLGVRRRQRCRGEPDRLPAEDVPLPGQR